MNETMDLKAKLGIDVFKPGGAAHIKIRPGKGKDPRLQKMAIIPPVFTVSMNRERRP